MYSYKCCENCSNNPKNGGSGVCNCTLPYYEQSATPSKTYWNDYTYWPNTFTTYVYKNNKYSYRKKSSEIEAIQWTGDNYVDVCLFMSREVLRENNILFIETVDKKMKVEIGDYIIKNTNNNVYVFYPCKPDIFEKEYEKV